MTLYRLLYRLFFCLVLLYSLSAVAADKPVGSEEEIPGPEQSQLLEQLPPDVLAKLSPEQIAQIIKIRVQGPETLAQTIFDQEIIVPAIVFGSFAGIAFLFAYFSYRKRRDLLTLVQEAIKSGHPLPSSFLESLENRKRPTAESDLRKAVILIALGLSSIVIIYTVADVEQRGAAAVGILPLLVGIAYLFLWKSAKPEIAETIKRID